MGERQGVGPTPPPNQVEAEDPKATPIEAYYKLFMGANPSKFNDRDRKDKTKSWLIEIEKAFNVIELLDRLKVRYKTYMLVEDA